MACSNSTRIMFVPYNPRHARSSSEASLPVSQQKHAAREYHRKAKQRRISTGKTPNEQIIGTRPRSAQEYTRPRPLQPNGDRPAFPRSQSVQEQSRPRIWSLFDSQRTGKLDPFDTFVVKGLPSHAHELFDYGESTLVLFRIQMGSTTMTWLYSCSKERKET